MRESEDWHVNLMDDNYCQVFQKVTNMIRQSLSGCYRSCTFLMFASGVCAPGLAEDSALQQFRNEYPRAVEKIRKTYSELKIVSELTTEPNTGRGKYTYLASQGFYRLDFCWHGEPVDHESSVVFGPEGSFVIDRKPGKQDYCLRSLDQAIRSPENTINSISKISPIAFAPFQYQSSPLKQRLKEPEFAIESAAPCSINPTHIILKWHWGEEAPRSMGQFKFDRTNSWALVSYNVKAEASDGWRPEVFGQLEYEGQIHGVPLIKSLITWAEDKQTGKVIEKQTSVVKEIVQSQVDAEQFKLAAFKIHMEQGPPPSRTGRWLIVVGVVGIGMALLLKFLAPRKKELHHVPV